MTCPMILVCMLFKDKTKEPSKQYVIIILYCLFFRIEEQNDCDSPML